MIIDAVILGVLQGLTEFLPISSSGHLIIAEWASGWQGELINNLTFDVALHAGTLFAIMWYFRRDWYNFARALLKAAAGRAREYEARLVLFIAVATIPAGIAGLLIEQTVEHAFRHPLMVSGALVFGSLVMYLSDRYSATNRRLASMTLGHALMIGVAQAFALIPGVSRSGITISAALAAGYKREDAARFSFLLSAPIIAGAGLVKVRHITFEGHAAWGCILGTLSAAVAGYIAVRFLIKYLERHSLNIFVLYRLVLAGLVILFWAKG